jgi:hypothetical protein
VLARVIEVAIGVGIAFGVIAFGVQRSCARFRSRHPKVGQVWRSAPRSLRRRVRRAIRKGGAIERADALVAIDGIDTTLKLRRARTIRKRQEPMRRRLVSYTVLFLASIVLAAIARPQLSAFAAIYAGYFGVIALLTGIALVQRRNWDERWLPRLHAARQKAVVALDT